MKRSKKERTYPTTYFKFKFMFLKCVFTKVPTNGSEQSPEADPFLHGNLLFNSGGVRNLGRKNKLLSSVWEIG